MIGHKIRIVLMIYRFQLPLGRSIDRCFSSGSIAKKARWFFRDHATASALRKFLENNCNNKDSGRAVRLINGSFTEFCRGSFVRRGVTFRWHVSTKDATMVVVLSAIVEMVWSLASDE
jgi:hypothetical protein